jgi:glycosyltransferase involved in cell wall biosynthesis
MTQKNIIISTDQQSFWQSCEIIEGSLKKCFEKISNHHALSFYNFKEARPSREELSTLNKILTSSAHKSKIFINSHLIDIPYFVSNLETKNVHLLFYVMGDMTIEVKRWNELDQVLKGFEVTLLCASNAQVEQVKLFTNGLGSLCEYPVATTPFSYSPPESINFIYAGRITAQKNINKLLRVFNEASKIKKNITLSIAGDFHARTYPFYGSAEDENNNYKTEFYNLIKESHGLITYHGNLDQEGLYALLNESSHFINISTYMDEDFSIGTAQAMSCGLKLITSQWGGLKDHLPDNSRYKIPVELTSNNLYQPNLKELFRSIILSSAHSKVSSREINKYFESKYSIDKISEKLLVTLLNNGQPYKGQSKLFHEYSQQFNLPRFKNNSTGCPFYANTENEKILTRELIQKIYSSYS